MDDTAFFFRKSKTIHTLYRRKIQWRVLQWYCNIYKNPEPSIMQMKYKYSHLHENCKLGTKKSSWKSDTIHSGGTDQKWNGPYALSEFPIFNGLLKWYANQPYFEKLMSHGFPSYLKGWVKATTAQGVLPGISSPPPTMLSLLLAFVLNITNQWVCSGVVPSACQYGRSCHFGAFSYSICNTVRYLLPLRHTMKMVLKITCFSYNLEEWAISALGWGEFLNFNGKIKYLYF